MRSGTSVRTLHTTTRRFRKTSRMPKHTGLRKGQVKGLCLKRFAQVQSSVAFGARAGWPE
eukprot:scaffold315_cov101-Isochrysis_galbana.AAC.4